MSCGGILPLGLSFTPTCLGGTPGPHWRYVDAHVRNADGTLERETLWRSRWDDIFYDQSHIAVSPEELSRLEILRNERGDQYAIRDRIAHLREHIESGDLYDQSMTGDDATIAAKSFNILILGSVPYALGMMTVNILAAAVHLLIVIKEAFSELYDQGCVDGLPAFFARLATGLWDDVLPDLFTVVASPIYWLGIETGALVGLISQNDGMRIISKVERAWHRNASYRDDVRYGVRRSDYTLDFIHKVLFLAWCFQSRKNRAQDIATPENPAAKYQIIDRERRLEPRIAVGDSV